jgi:hypothetical protein
MAKLLGTLPTRSTTEDNVHLWRKTRKLITYQRILQWHGIAACRCVELINDHSFFGLIYLFWKNKRRLIKLPCVCLCICLLPHSDLYAYEITLLTVFLLKSVLGGLDHLDVFVYVSKRFFSFYMIVVSYRRKVGDKIFPEIPLYSTPVQFAVCSVTSEIIKDLKPKQKPKDDKINNTNLKILRNKIIASST